MENLSESCPQVYEMVAKAKFVLYSFAPYQTQLKLATKDMNYTKTTSRVGFGIKFSLIDPNIYPKTASHFWGVMVIAQPQFRISTKCPSIAAAAAIAGETRCVRPLKP